MAETYHILDYRALPVSLLATLVFGLKEDSRVMLSLSKMKISTETLLLASIADRLGLLVWANTKDAQRNKNRPQSIVEALTKPKKEKDYKVFKSVEEFEAARAELLKGVSNNA